MGTEVRTGVGARPSVPPPGYGPGRNHSFDLVVPLQVQEAISGTTDDVVMLPQLSTPNLHETCFSYLWLLERLMENNLCHCKMGWRGGCVKRKGVIDNLILDAKLCYISLGKNELFFALIMVMRWIGGQTVTNDLDWEILHKNHFLLKPCSASIQ